MPVDRTRRALLARAGLTGAALLVGTACSADGDGDDDSADGPGDGQVGGAEGGDGVVNETDVPTQATIFGWIGEVFDHVYGEGGSMITQRNVQTTMVPAGGSAIVEFRAEKPGTLVLVDHAIFRAFNKGALAMIKVVGQDDPRVFAQLKGLPMAGH